MAVVNPFIGWFRDALFLRLFKNAGILLSGNVSASFVEMLSLALTARALGPENFGYLVLIQTYIRIIDTLFNFQSWQAIIKFSADALSQKRIDDFKSLIKFGTLLDAFSSFLALGMAFIGIYLLGSWAMWSPLLVNMAYLYSVTLIFNLVFTQLAVLRIFDQFKLLAVGKVSVALVKLVIILIAFLFGAGLWVFVFIWMLMSILDYSVVIFLGWRELLRRGYRNILIAKVSNISEKYSGIWKFVLTTNLSSSIRLGDKELDVFLVGVVLGPATTGLYKIAKQFGSIPGRLADPIQQAVYPELARLWANNERDKFIGYIFKTGVLVGAGGLLLWLGFFVFGRNFLDLVVGSEYVEAYGMLLLIMVGNVIFLFGISFRPSILSMQYPEVVLKVFVMSEIVFLIFFLVFTKFIGVEGAAIAHIFFNACWFVGMLFSVRNCLRVREGLVIS